MTPLLAGFLSWTGALFWLVVVASLLASLGRRVGGRARLDVRGCWMLVTGCDSGFGLGVVERLAARGARVVACTLTAEGSDRAVAAGAEWAPHFDLCDAEAVHEVVVGVRERCAGRLWGVVHNAGVALPGFIEYLPPSQYRRVLDVNFFAVVTLMQALLPLFEVRSGGRVGRVVVVSSVDGIVSLPGNAAYDASKFAVDAWADALRVELSSESVAVSVVNPGTMRTPLALGFFDRHREAWEEMERLDPEGAWKRRYPREWLERFIAANGPALERIAQDPSHAIDDIVHALTARRPELRYLSGTMAKTFFRALWIMPERWSTRLKRALMRPLPPTDRRVPETGSEPGENRSEVGGIGRGDSSQRGPT